MRHSKIFPAAVTVAFLFMQVEALSVNTKREVVKTRAVSFSYETAASAYTNAQRACQKYWKSEIKNLISERPSFSVEIVTVNTKPKRVSALCISKRYVNDKVTRVAKR